MSGLFSTPKPPKVAPMPDPDDTAVRDQALRDQLAARMRSGRASTILSGDDRYSRATTGAP